MEPHASPSKPNMKNRSIYIIRDKVTRRREDRHLLVIAMALQSSGYNVTLYTSEMDDPKALEADGFCKFPGNVDVCKCAEWVPNTIFGFFKGPLSLYRSISLSLKALFSMKLSPPSVVIVDSHLIALFLMKSFTSAKVFYVEQFRSLKDYDLCFEHSYVSPTLLESSWIHSADEVIVESPGFVDILKRSYPIFAVEPKVLPPCIDCGLWNEPAISLDRIIPDIGRDFILLVTFGRFREAANFKLVIEAFELLLEGLVESKMRRKLHLVIAGQCKSTTERDFYMYLVDDLKQRSVASQITILRQLPTIHQKTLIAESTVVLHPAINDVYSDFILAAMSLGKPIIATTRGIGQRILEHRITGVLVEPHAQTMATAIHKIVTSPHVQNFLGEMTKDVFLHNYSFDSFTKKLVLWIDKQTNSAFDVSAPLKSRFN